MAGGLPDDAGLRGEALQHDCQQGLLYIHTHIRTHTHTHTHSHTHTYTYYTYHTHMYAHPHAHALRHAHTSTKTPPQTETQRFEFEKKGLSINLTSFFLYAPFCHKKGCGNFYFGYLSILIFRTGKKKKMCFYISTEGALRVHMTYDDHPIHPIPKYSIEDDLS